MTPVPTAVVDAFTDRPFSGNPAGVCVLAAEPDPGWMQQVAAELRHSETAFCWPLDEAGADASAATASAAAAGGPADAARWGLRWFTPATEVELCGHATLAAGHWLRERGAVDPGRPVAFATASGTLTSAPAHGLEWLDFPARPVTPSEPPAELLAALAPVEESATAGVLAAAARIHGRSGEGDWLVELPDADAIEQVAPDFAWLATLGRRGVIVTAAGDGEVDFVSRFFAPAVGIDEDPVTGSAHCTLAPFWAERLGRVELTAEQRSPRGGRLHLRVDGDRVRLGGRAATVLTGGLAHAAAR